MRNMCEKYNYVIKIYYNKTNCILKKYIYDASRVTSILNILKVTYPNSDIVIYDKSGNRYTINSWLSHSE